MPFSSPIVSSTLPMKPGAPVRLFGRQAILPVHLGRSRSSKFFGRSAAGTRFVLIAAPRM
jgi:hypothetical protein